ncbi:MAG: tRNA (N6-isopentenyl adenosine(37)-C2)-methylthiotransferase MiaB [Elusimicrobiota bacterium]|nr:tRNA (N6-isopentenyl adenosine(37)-C2)-methylthiotransferase MiaB [Elusimicrobiota bacterium]
MKYIIETIGCQMNENESFDLAETLSHSGILQAKTLQEANIVILNTCSVRAQAEQKAFSFLGRAERIKKENSSVKIIVIGCMAQRIPDKIKKRFKNIDFIAGTKEANLAEKILKLLPFSEQPKSLPKENLCCKLNFGKIVRHITIMKGCNNYCSYCVVPFVRGQEISFDYKKIMNDCVSMVENGTKEIILLGQNVNSYKYGEIDFSKLISKIAKIESLTRIRFMTNHPKDLNDDLIEIMSKESKVCRHIHLPMQSASDKILEQMNRKYTFKHYLNLIKNLRTAMPDISITTDVIVGFPGESQKNFEETLNAIKDIKFDGLYVFRYSQRPNTKAAQIPDDVSLEEKKHRHSVILKESNEISAKIAAAMVNTKQEVLGEKFENGILSARTRSCRKVFITTDKTYLGKQFYAFIKSAKINSLFGEIR